MSDDSDDPFATAAAAAADSLDDSDDDDPFTFQKHAFAKRRAHLDSCCSPSSKRGRPSKRKGAFDESVLDRLDAQAAKKLHFDSDEDDSVDEKPSGAPNKKQDDGVVVLDVDSSDDDDNHHGYATSTLAQRIRAAPLCQTLQQSQLARQKLTEAQRYHAEDVHVPDDDDEPPPERPSPMMLDTSPSMVQASSSSKTKTQPQDLGAVLHLTLRTTKVLQGKRSSSSTTDVLTIRQRQPLQCLLDAYRDKTDTTNTNTKIVFMFDGEKMDCRKTPMAYDMEDEDLIDVMVMMS